MKKILLIILLVVLITSVIGLIIYTSNQNKPAKKEEGKLNIVVTSFSGYDFAKQITKDKANVNFLLGPGVDSHSYEPTPQDIIDISNADMFIYVGGETEKWVDKTIDSFDQEVKNRVKWVKLADVVDLVQEEEIEGAEHVHDHDEEEEHSDHEHEEGHTEESHDENHEEEVVEGAFDEHIWSSPANAIKMINNISNEIIKLDEANKEEYEQNAQNYIHDIRKVQSEIKEIVDNKKRDRLVFGDKMPMQYFIKEFGLKVSAAFAGCSTEAEPSTKTISFLVDKVKEENIPVVLYIELNNGKVAKTIADEVGAKAMQIQTLHNVSKADFENGETYVSLMSRNLEVLKTALQ